MNLSIIIPALNESAGIAQAIERAWALEPLEVIVVDGSSDDATAEIARQQRCTLIEGPRGRGVQQNLGVSQSTGDVLLFLHADNWLDPAGAKQIEQTLSNPRVLAGAFRQRIEAPGLAYRLLEWGNAMRVRWFGMAYGDQGIFMRRAVFDQLGRFPDVRLMEDWLLMRQLRKITRPALLPGPLHVSARRWQKRGVLRQTLLNWRLIAAARRGADPDELAELYR